ncbi:glycosyltransferase family 2 protein [Aureimonas fodinaquatilis]|uniref:Glycosyltransferase family 2 protein n=1 Tax=Aureimonas fodinaquatilis TaxID=2565783 RepID=A0A5B0DV73_9HYPH|nr:glycosyltransferase family 2 protein [Aureimonas fodinaquatilis]KAA0970717.1 glycosyltransferase family 2 protein [Aureimonas fodinaquatilis]
MTLPFSAISHSTGYSVKTNSPIHHFYPVIAIPARNEEQRLPLLLSALGSQTWLRATARPIVVKIVINNSTDKSLEMARLALDNQPGLSAEIAVVNFPPDLAHVGSARKLAMDLASSACPAEGGVILTTDADAIPEANWIEANLAAISSGADLVGGCLNGNRKEEAQLGPGFAARARAVMQYSRLCDRLASLIDPLEHDPWPRHSDNTGGSLAIKAQLYQSLGGLPAIPLREDLALVSMARSAGGKLVHPLNVRVEVSARLAGRAQGGMADCLKNWIRAEAEGAPILVEDPERVLARLARRRAIRESADSSCALVELLAPDEPDAPATVKVAEATQLICRIISEVEGTTDAA